MDEEGLIKHVYDSEIRLGLVCSKCKRDLLPITSGNAVTFFCDNAHETPIDQIIGTESSNSNATLHMLVGAWHKNALALELLAKEAQTNGHAKAVDILKRHIRTLEDRIEVLKNALQRKPPDRS